MIPVHLVPHRTTVAIRAGPEAEALLHDSAGQGVELRDPTRMRHTAAANAARGFDGKGDANSATDARSSEFRRVVRVLDFASDVLEVRASFIAAITIAAGPAASSRADCGARPRSAT